MRVPVLLPLFAFASLGSTWFIDSYTESGCKGNVPSNFGDSKPMGCQTVGNGINSLDLQPEGGEWSFTAYLNDDCTKEWFNAWSGCEDCPDCKSFKVRTILICN